VGVVARLEPGATVLAAADSKRGFPIAAVKPDFDLVRFDLNIPGLSGIPALKAWAPLPRDADGGAV
jgi:CheY-like chemotaxis protein